MPHPDGLDAYGKPVPRHRKEITIKWIVKELGISENSAKVFVDRMSIEIANDNWYENYSNTKKVALEYLDEKAYHSVLGRLMFD